MKKLGIENDCSFREEQPMDEEEDMDIKFDDEPLQEKIEEDLNMKFSYR